MNFITTNKYFFLIILTIATLIIPKLIISNFFYPNEENFVSFVFENPGSSYLPIIKSYSEFDLNPSYMTGGGNSQLISFPYLAVFINSIFLKFFQPYSFVIVKFISFLFFFLIFTKILNYCGFEKIEAIFITFFLFLIPTILTDLIKFDIQFINLIKDNYINFYSDRIPRPLVTNLYFFLFILLLIKLKINETFDLKTAFFFGITMGLSFHSFFPHFFIEFFTLLFLLIYNKYFIIKHLIQNKKFYLILISTISLFIIVFFIQFHFSNPDHLNIVGTKSVNLSQKIILIKYFLYFIFNKIFIVLFIINSVLFIFTNKKEKELQIFYFLFLCSIISFIFFIIISNKSTHYYLFQNWILINGTIYPFLIISKYFINYLKSFNFKYKGIFVLLIYLTFFIII